MSTAGPKGEKRRGVFLLVSPVRAQSQVSRRSNEFRHKSSNVVAALWPYDILFELPRLQ
jgi:hypothetical protein